MRVFSYKKKNAKQPQIEIHGTNNTVNIANKNNPHLKLYINGDNNLVEIRTTDYFFATPNSVYAGSPAKLIKTSVQWSHQRSQRYIEQHMQNQ